MRYVLTNAEMRAADEFTMESGVSSRTLMERAGKAVAKLAEKALSYLSEKSVAVVCGSGNNGGDGYCAARILAKKGFSVVVFEAFPPKTVECQLENARCRTPRINTLKKGYGLVIDCLYGTGFHGTLNERAAQIVKEINESGAFVLAADIPSGLAGDNGLCAGEAVRADMTAVIGEFKAGHLFNDGPDLCGELRVCDIGIDLPENDYMRMYAPKDLCALFPKRKCRSNKGDYGRVAILGGSERYSGAPLLGMSALRAGAGYVRLCVPDCIFSPLIGKYPEAILKKMPSKNGVLAYDEAALSEIAAQSDSIAVGMGCCKDREIYRIVRYLLEHFTGTLVLDADALNSLAEFGVNALENRRCTVILTPHVKEFSRLCQTTVQEVCENGTALARAFAKRYGVTLMLKSNATLISDQSRAAVSSAGSPALAKGGSGDVLAGLTAAIAARTDDTVLACACASFILGESAVSLSQTLGEYGVCASDLLQEIPKTVKKLESLARIK